MGVCCNSDMRVNGERFIRELLQSEALILREKDYMDLLNDIVSKRVEQEIPKSHVEEYIIPDVYKPQKSTENTTYLQTIFSTILDDLNEKNNMYVVLLYFYPFIKHDKEKTYENFFHCLRFITQSLVNELKIEDLYYWLVKYISFCTKEITNAVRSKLPPSDEISISLAELNKTNFTNNNIMKFVNRLLEEMTEGNNVDLITIDMFKRLFNKYDLSNIEKIRDYLLFYN